MSIVSCIYQRTGSILRGIGFAQGTKSVACCLYKCDNKWYLMSILQNCEIFTISKKLLNKLSYVPKVLLQKYMAKNSALFSLLSLYFPGYFAQYLKISLADMRYLLLWRVKNVCYQRRCIGDVLYLLCPAYTVNTYLL